MEASRQDLDSYGCNNFPKGPRTPIMGLRSQILSSNGFWYLKPKYGPLTLRAYSLIAVPRS